MPQRSLAVHARWIDKPSEITLREVVIPSFPRFRTGNHGALIVMFELFSRGKAVAVLVAVRFEIPCGLLHSPALNESVSH